MTESSIITVMNDHNYTTDKKSFRKMFRELTDEPHSFMVVNYSNPMGSRYMDKHFNPVNASDYS